MKLENRIRYKCRIWLSVVHWSQKTIFEPIKNKFSRSKFFGQKLRWKKFIWNWKIEFAAIAEYDSAWCTNQEKLYLSLSKNQFLRSKFFRPKLRLKKFLWNWKKEFATNAGYDSAWFTDHKKLNLSPSKINFQDRNFLVKNWGEKNLFEIGK